METATTAPRERLLKLPDVLSIVGMKKSAWYQGIKDGKHPAPRKRGKESLWPESTINAYVQEFLNSSK